MYTIHLEFKKKPPNGETSILNGKFKSHSFSHDFAALTADPSLRFTQSNAS